MTVAGSALQAALSYAALGWHVFPCHTPRPAGTCSCRKRDCGSAGKHPRTINGFKDATADVTVIRGWWELWPDANVGVACGPSGLVVLDVDPRHGGDESLRDLITRHNDPSMGMKLPGQDRGEAAGPDILNTVTAQTGGGGAHLLYHCPEGVFIPSVATSERFAGPLGPGIDVRAAGGYIIAPPSLHESGQEYAWVVDQGPGETDLLVLPDWLEQLLCQRAIVPAAPRVSYAEILSGVSEGGRDRELFRAASAARRLDIPYEWTLGLILEAAANCSPPFPPEQARRKVQSAYDHYPPSASALGDITDPSSTGLFVWAKDLDQVPPIEWLIEDVMPEDALGALIGNFGSGKTFAGLDMACSIATGKHWHGKDVRQGPVVYIYAEGLRGLRARLRAWEDYHQREVEQIAFVRRAVHFLDDTDFQYFLDQMKEHLPEAPVAVFIDTLARAMAGGDENATKDMSILVDRADQVRQRTGAAVWLVHHLNKQHQYRGSSVMPGTLDVMIEVQKKENNLLRLVCQKMKDAEEFKPILLRKELRLASIVLVSAEEEGTPAQLPEGAMALLDLLNKYPEGVRPKEAVVLLGLSASTLLRHLKTLTASGLAVSEGMPGPSLKWFSGGEKSPKMGNAVNAVNAVTTPSVTAFMNAVIIPVGDDGVQHGDGVAQKPYDGVPPDWMEDERWS